MIKQVDLHRRQGINAKSRLLLLFLLIAPMFACQSVETPTADNESQRISFVSQLAPHYAVSAGKNTVSWKPDGSLIQGNEHIDADSYKRSLEDAIVATLKSKGYTFSEDTKQADLLVSYAAGLETELSDAEVTQRFGMIPGLQGQTSVDGKYEKGTIVVDIYDKLAGKSVWRGVVQGFANLELSPDERSRRLKNLMRQLMAEFPSML